MKLIGLDSSTQKTGVCIVEDGKPIAYKLIDLHKLKDPEVRIDNMIKQIISVLEKIKPDVIFQEYTWVAKNPRSALMLTQIIGATRGWSLQNDVEWHKIEPTVWRKHLHLNEYLAKRPELKERAIDLFREATGMEPPSDDVSDAFGIAMAGWKIKDM